MPATSLTPERSALKAALGRHAVAVERVARVRSAKLKAWQLSGADAVEAAERALFDARKAETTAVLSGLLGETAPPRLSVADAERALAEARAAQDAAEQARLALLGEEELAASHLRAAEAERAAAIGGVVRTEVLVKLLPEYQTALRRWLYLRALLGCLPGKSTQESNELSVTQYEIPATALLRPWNLALEKIAEDPTAPLPDAAFSDDDFEHAAAAA